MIIIKNIIYINLFNLYMLVILAKNNFTNMKIGFNRN